MGTAAAKSIFYTQARWDVHRSIIGTIIPSQISQHHFLEIGCFFSSVLAPQKGSKRLTISPLWVESPGRASNFQLLDTPISHVRDEATNAPLVSWRTLPTALQVSMRRPRFQRSCSSSVLPRIPPPMTAATSTVTSS